jgi:3-methyladenine DNA glycosylase AlkD
MPAPKPTGQREKTPTLAHVRRKLREAGDADDAGFLQRFFKTGPGDYGAGDKFLGIRVPATRQLAREFRGLPLGDVAELLRDPWHEARLLGLIMLANAYQRGTPAEQERIFKLYLANTDRVNNWDLVDLSAPNIVGVHLATRPRTLLDKLARSKSLWERRIAIVATQHLIRRGEFDDTLRVARILLDDRHDLIHKAVGWMLREVGNNDRAALEAFLDEHADRMPRTMLRYAIEKMSAAQRQAYLRRGGTRLAKPSPHA